MSGETLLVFLLLLITIIIFVSDRLRLDVVAMLVILALMLSGLLSPKEALAGFGDPVVLLIAGLFVVGEGLFRTGIAFAIGNWLMRVSGTSETRMMILLMLVVAGLSAFMSSTGAVAIFIPITVNLAAMTVAQALLRTRYGVTVLGIERQQRGRTMIIPAATHTELNAGDIILVVDTAAELDRMLKTEKLELLEVKSEYSRIAAQEVGVAEVLLTPRSTIIGRTLSKIRFRERYGLTVLGILRNGKPVEGNLVQTELFFGDSALVGGGWRQIELLQAEHENFLVLNLPREMDEIAPNRSKALWALGIMGGMLVLMAFKLMPSVTAVLLTALAMVFAGCVSMKNAYDSINWESLVLLPVCCQWRRHLKKQAGLSSS